MTRLLRNLHRVATIWALFALATLSLGPSALAVRVRHPQQLRQLQKPPQPQVPTVITIGSTIPTNGDLNPYGVAVAKHTFSKSLRKGDILVSNFNNQSNLAGTGTTIVRFPAGVIGNGTLFAHVDPRRVPCDGGIGLTTALGILSDGFVVVGSLRPRTGPAPPRGTAA